MLRQRVALQRKVQGRIIITEAESEEISHYNEETFYDACKQDIHTANQGITIASPFLASARVKKLLPLLLEKQQQGVKITIYTRPLKESEDWHREAAQLLLGKGLQLAYRPEMHQKAVIIDENILYHGSFNVLSQRDTRESMLRIIKKPQLIAALSEGLQAPAIRSQKVRTMVEGEIQKMKTISVPLRLLPNIEATCSCGNHFVPRLNTNDGSVFYTCTDFPNCKKQKFNLTLEHLQHVEILQKKICNRCGNTLELQFQDRPQLFFFSCENQCEEKQRIVFMR